jgi:cytochrome c oxidase cbb3-type subunit 4
MTTGDVSTFEAWRDFAASWGFAYFALIFIGALAFVLRPSRREYFDEAGKIPLRED